MYFWQYWDFCSLCRYGCCSQNLFTSIQFIQLFIIPLWSPSLSLFLSPPSLSLFLVPSVCLCLCTVCFYCHKGTFSDPSSCGDGHLEGPSDGTGLFTSSELSIEYALHGQNMSFWHDKTNTGKYRFDNVECLLCMGKTGGPTMSQALHWDRLLKCLCR